jgi:hypothetical protein
VNRNVVHANRRSNFRAVLVEIDRSLIVEQPSHK